MGKELREKIENEANKIMLEMENGSTTICGQRIVKLSYARSAIQELVDTITELKERRGRNEKTNEY